MRRLGFVIVCLLWCACNAGRDKLLADLQSEHAEQRALAVRKLGEAHRPDDVILFTRAAHDAAAIVREEAATALGGTGVPDVVDVLAELAEDPQESVQVKAVQALAHFPSQKARGFLVLQYSRRGRATRAAIIEALGGQGSTDAASELVSAEAKTLWNRYTQALHDGTLAEQVAAAEVLGQSGRPEAVELLLPLVKDRQLPLAAAAIRGLSSAGDPRAKALCVAALNEAYPELRQSAIEGLRELKATDDAAPLLAVVKEGSAASLSAIHALADLPRTPEIDAGICSASVEADSEASVTAAEIMRGRGGCPLKVVAPSLAPNAPRAKVIAALRAVGRWGSTAKDTLPLVSARLSSKDPEIMVWAARAIGAIGDATQVEPLTAIYESALARLAAAREDWIKEPFKNEPAPNFNPDPVQKEIPGRSTRASDEQKAQFYELLSKLKHLDEQRRNGATAADVPVPEIAPDTDEVAVRELAASLEALGMLHAPIALDGVKAFLNETNPLLHEAALLAAAHLGKAGIALIHDQVRVGDPERQTRLARALWESGDDGQAAVIDAIAAAGPGKKLALLQIEESSGPIPASIPALEGVTKTGGIEAISAVRQLGMLKSRSSVPVLVESLRDPNTAARREALWALGQIGNPSTAAVVAQELCHESPEVRAAAAQALVSLGTGTPAQTAMLRALGHDYFRSVRDAAGRALAAHGGPTNGAAH